MYIQNCHFYVVDHYAIRSRAPISVTINNTLIEGRGIDHSSKINLDLLHVTIVNVVLTNKMRYALRIVVSLKPSIKITDSTFNDVINAESIVYIVCSSDRTCEKPLSSSGVIIQNTSFLNSIVGNSVLELVRQSMRFTNSKIVNNTYNYNNTNFLI